VLLLAVPLDGGWVLLTVLPPVIGVAGPPFLRTVQAYLAVFRICGDLPAVIIGAAPPLAFGIAAYRLPRLKLRWLEGSLTIATLPFDHTGRLSHWRDATFTGRFRNCYRVGTASWPMAGFL
jgi:hypothetical protein